MSQALLLFISIISRTNKLLKHQLRGRKSRINRTIAEREESLFMRFLEEALGPEVMSDDDTDGSPDSMEESASVVPPVLNPLNHIWFRTFLLLSTYILPLVCLPCLCSLQLLGFVFSPIPIVSSFFGFVAIMLVRFPLIFLYDDFIPTVLNEFFGDKV